MRTLLTGAAAAFLLAAPAAADLTVSHSFTSSVARGAIRRVIVDVPSGEVIIRNGAADRIRISGSVEREYDDDRSRDKVQQAVDEVAAEISVQGDTAVIRRVFGPGARSWKARNWNTGFHITVEVPRRTDVDIETKYGELTMEGDFGDIDADLRAGEITLRLPRASVAELNASVRIGEVHADYGDQRQDNEGIFPGSTHFINTGGRSHINVHTTVGELRVTLTR